MAQNLTYSFGIQAQDFVGRIATSSGSWTDLRNLDILKIWHHLLLKFKIMPDYGAHIIIDLACPIVIMNY